MIINYRCQRGICSVCLVENRDLNRKNMTILITNPKRMHPLKQKTCADLEGAGQDRSTSNDTEKTQSAVQYLSKIMPLNV